MPAIFPILFGAAWTVAVSAALGLLILRRLSIELHREEEIPLAFITGAAGLSLIVFLLCILQLVYGAVFLVLGSLILIAAFYSGCFRPRAEKFQPLPPLWRGLFFGIGTIFGVLYLCHAMAPEISPDGATYHLGLVGRYWRHHGFERITTNMYANLSQGVEMLFLFAYGFGRHSAAAMVHLAFLVAALLMIMNYGRRFGFPKAGVVAALFFFVSPVVGMDGTVAYNDVATSCIIFSVFYLLQVWARTRASALLIPIGLLAGFSYAAKYTAFLALPYALIFLFWKLVRGREPWLRPLAVVCGCALIMIVPWMAKNWFWLDNPFSPFFNSWFPNPYIHPSFEAGYANHMRNYELSSRWSIPLEVTVRGTKLCGLVGPLFLLAPMALLALRHPHGRNLLLAATVFGATYATNIGTRFLIPALPYVSLALALAIGHYRGVALSLALIHALLSWPPVMRKYSDPGSWKLESVQWREALRIKDEEEFLRSNLLGYATARAIEEVVPPGEKVFSFGNIAEAYTTREILVAYQSASNEILGEMLWTPFAPHGQPVRQLQFRFPSSEARKLRLVQTAASVPDHWSVSELRIYSLGKDLHRDPAWRLRAHPNPWDVQRAFDNSAITRWSSWQPAFEGMFLEVDLGSIRTADAVVLECSADQPNIRLRLEVADRDGNWKLLSSSPTIREIPPPPGLRRAATAEIKNSGVRYLLIHENDFGRDDYENRRLEWGIVLAAEAEGKRLYAIQ
jgi:hypothetical protein